MRDSKALRANMGHQGGGRGGIYGNTGHMRYMRNIHTRTLEERDRDAAQQREYEAQWLESLSPADRIALDANRASEADRAAGIDLRFLPKSLWREPRDPLDMAMRN